MSCSFRRWRCGAASMLALSLTVSPCVSVRADVWQRGGDGELTLHRTLDHFQRARMAADWRPPTANTLADRRRAYAHLIDTLSLRFAVASQLVNAIVEVESAYDAAAVSKAGAIGLMQLMPKTVARFGVVDPLDPQQNLEAGIRYLRLLRDEFESVELVLAAYNAGEDAVRRYGNHVPPFAETRAYVARAQALMERQPSEQQ